jgi:hypothetical protein
MGNVPFTIRAFFTTPAGSSRPTGRQRAAAMSIDMDWLATSPCRAAPRRPDDFYVIEPFVGRCAASFMKWRPTIAKTSRP